MAELDATVTTLESNSLELEESLKAYERGVALLADLQARLANANKKSMCLWASSTLPPTMRPLTALFRSILAFALH